MQAIEKRIFEARVSNWVAIIQDNFKQIIVEHINDPDFGVKLQDGTYLEMAQELFCEQVKQGKYDKMCMPIECNL